MNQNYYCVIMAGGAGTRFWPLSRAAHPKQFIDILGTGRTLLQQTFDRYARICPKENILIVTSSEYKDITAEQLPEIAENQILLEPARRNTAPCIAYANFRIQQQNPDALVIVAPSDHLILNEQAFLETMHSGLDFIAQHDCLLTLGIKPTRPDTGYGYIQLSAGQTLDAHPEISKVKTFTEKPKLELAKSFVDSGEFYWNSGMFLWSVKSIQQAFEEHLPEIYTAFNEKASLFGSPQEQEAIREIYPACPNISIDFGLMEKSKQVYVLGADFGWSDLGTWTSLYEHMEKDGMSNARSGKNILTYQAKNAIIKADHKKLVVVKGLEDYIVVDTEDALLICPKDDEQQIKLFVNDIKTQTGNKFI